MSVYDAMFIEYDSIHADNGDVGYAIDTEYDAIDMVPCTSNRAYVNKEGNRKT